MREEGEETRAVLDEHHCGIFGHEDWLRIIGQVGFEAHWRPFEHSELPEGSTNIYLGLKPGFKPGLKPGLFSHMTKKFCCCLLFITALSR